MIAERTRAHGTEAAGRPSTGSAMIAAKKQNTTIRSARCDQRHQRCVRLDTKDLQAKRVRRAISYFFRSIAGTRPGVHWPIYGLVPVWQRFENGQLRPFDGFGLLLRRPFRSLVNAGYTARVALAVQSLGYFRGDQRRPAESNVYIFRKGGTNAPALR